MNTFKEIRSNAWIKNWSANWHTAFSSLYFLYTTDLKPYIGRNLKTNLLTCEKKVSSNYIAKKELDSYCQYIAELVKADNKLAQKWGTDTLLTTKKLFDIIKKIKLDDKLTISNLHLLKQAFYSHIPPHFSMKKVVDYLPKRLQKKLFPQLARVRIKTENLFNEVDNVLRLYSNLIAQKTKYSTDLTDFLTIDEIQVFLREKSLPNKKELNIRSGGMAIFCVGKEFDLLIGSEYIRLQRILISKVKNELQGNIAYPGFAQGRVRIVFDPFSVKKFDKGDILVTGMTRPEFLALMKKASAFVTDAGGMLSHAAIVARELKKPCILGTEIATKIFKDGDMVEVDANNGIIRKIK